MAASRATTMATGPERSSPQAVWSRYTPPRSGSKRRRNGIRGKRTRPRTTRRLPCTSSPRRYISRSSRRSQPTALQQVAGRLAAEQQPDGSWKVEDEGDPRAPRSHGARRWQPISAAGPCKRRVDPSKRSAAPEHGSVKPALTTCTTKRPCSWPFRRTQCCGSEPSIVSPTRKHRMADGDPHQWPRLKYSTPQWLCWR